MPEGSSARRGDVLLLVGTRKGSFVFTSEPSRRKWEMSGPHNPGADVFHLTFDQRSGGRILAAVNNMIWGPQLEYTDDLGKTWTSATEQPRFSVEVDP